MSNSIKETIINNKVNNKVKNVTTTELLKEKQIETLFENKGNFDKKSKLNLNPNSKVSLRDLELISTVGITSEMLKELDTEIKVYRTQITLHSDFSELLKDHKMYINGYKSLVVNKNNSLGVKYVAIDAGKRKQLAKYLKLAGIGFHSNSTESYFYKQIMLSGEGTDLDQENFKQICDTFNTAKNSENLFTGSSHIYRINFYGMNFIVFKMVVSIIPEENVLKLANAFGVTETMLNEAENKIKMEQMELRNRYNKEHEIRTDFNNKLATDLIENHGFSEYVFMKEYNEVKFITADFKENYSLETDDYRNKLYIEYTAHFAKVEGRNRTKTILNKTFPNLYEAVEFAENNTFDEFKPQTFCSSRITNDRKFKLARVIE